MNKDKISDPMTYSQEHMKAILMIQVETKVTMDPLNYFGARLNLIQVAINGPQVRTGQVF